tara:strand:+ start:319 stop:636 length:318 start_codon:yes stop_codon:yes gene_type:complete
VFVNLRDTPIDKRYLSKADKAAYRGAAREKAIRRIKQKRGQLAWNENREIQTETRRPGTGGFTGGRRIQQERLRQIGADNARSKALRQEAAYLPELTARTEFNRN